MADMAELTGPLTTVGLARELKKLGPLNPQICLYRMKIQYREEIQREIGRMGNSRIQILQDGQVIRI
jgi:hypothetical protein